MNTTTIRNKMLSLFQDIWDLIVLLHVTVYLYAKAIYRYFDPPPPKSLVGKVVLITGSAGGIGRQICSKLARTGAILVCWDVDKRSNDDFVKTLVDETGVKAYSYKVDVSDRSHVQTAIQTVRNDVGEINVVINNAGIMPCKSFLKQTPEELEKSFQINVLAHFWILQEILPRMIELNDGHIVTVCSAAGLIPTRNLAPYSGTKHAVHGFIEALKEEMRHDKRKPNIKFTTVYPFACNTGLMSGINSHSRFPSIVKTVLQPEEVAEKLVDGFCREYEHIYVPGFVSFAGTTAKSLLPEVQRLSSDFMNCFVEPSNLQNGVSNGMK